jgi:hypothetical protein
VAALPLAEPEPSAAPGAAAGRVAYHPAAHADTVIALVRDRQAFASLGAAGPLPVEVTQWLARLRLLVDVPVAYLVADPTTLPRESLRFFEVDPGWVAALVDGAFAVGRSSHLLARHDEGLHALAHADAAPVVSGFLLESAVVAAWPRVEVRAFDAAGAELTALRTELLTARLLLFLAEGRAARFVLAAPPEGLHFGFDVRHDPAGEPVLTKRLRDGSRTVEVTTHGDVVRIAELAAALGCASVAELARQLVQGEPAVAFVASGA